MSETQPSSVIVSFMSMISEDYYAAGWLHDLEYDLWARVEQFQRTGRCSSWGGNWQSITESIRVLVSAAITLDEWGMWVEGKGSVTVPLSEWLEVHWPNAPQQYLDLAASEPICGDIGPMVRYRNPLDATRRMRFSYFSTCDLPAGHETDHEYTDNDGNRVTHDPVEPVLIDPEVPVPAATVQEIVNDDTLESLTLIESALEETPTLDNSIPAYIWIDPARLTGEPCIGGTRASVRRVADTYRWFGMRHTTSEYGFTRAQVLIACWFLGIYDDTVPLTPVMAGVLESEAGFDDGETRHWPEWWGEWAREATPALWERDYNRVPDPPRMPEWER